MMKIVIISLVFLLVSLSGCLDEEVEREINSNKEINNLQETQAVIIENNEPKLETKIDICERISKKYYETHIYLHNDIYDCDDMACDVWNELKFEGVESEIFMGNLEEDIYSDDLDTLVDQIELCNHAWLLAKTSSSNFVAIECTAGEVIYLDEHPEYLSGFVFSNPKNYRRFLVASTEYVNQVNLVDIKRFEYNDMVDQYNNMDYYSQISNKRVLEVYEQNLQEEVIELNILYIELTTIIEYG